eukprot:2005136-Rhodomonas_salina.2
MAVPGTRVPGYPTGYMCINAAVNSSPNFNLSACQAGLFGIPPLAPQYKLVPLATTSNQMATSVNLYRRMTPVVPVYRVPRSFRAIFRTL